MQVTLGARSLGVALVVCALVVGAGVAYATIPSSQGTFTACLTSSGTLRLIDSEAGQTCKKNETAVSWSQGARLACPAGTIMSTGVCIETTARAAATLPDAADDCGREGRRLPSPGELRTARLLDEVNLGGGEWTDDVADINRINSATGTPYGDFSYNSVGETSSGVHQAFDPQAYRCVAAAGIA